MGHMKPQWAVMVSLRRRSRRSASGRPCMRGRRPSTASSALNARKSWRGSAAITRRSRRSRTPRSTRDLAPGAHVWIEVETQYQQQIAGGPSAGGFRDSAPRREATTKHIWQFEVPASGEVAPESFEYQFPAANWTSSDHFGSIQLKTRFKIDDARGLRRTGYGEVGEVTFGMPVPPGSTQLSRCLRLHDEGNRLAVETAADCLDSTFNAARQGGHRVQMRLSSR